MLFERYQRISPAKSFPRRRGAHCPPAIRRHADTVAGSSCAIQSDSVASRLMDGMA